MKVETVLLADRGGCARLTLEPPEVHNAFDDQLIASADAQVARARSRPAVRVVVLAAAGKSFSAGADLNWMKRMAGYSEAENLRDAVALADLMHTLCALSKPTIARVQGAAFGGGVGLVACCDIAVGSRRRGLLAFGSAAGPRSCGISPYVIAAIGERHARRYFLTAERFDAGEALRIGLLHAMVAEARTRRGGRSGCRGTAAQGRAQGAGGGEELIAAVANRRIDRPLVEDTAERIARIRVSAEGKEGIAAFLEKRAAGWIGDE